MTRWAMVIDLDKCTGCQACSMACRVENNQPFVGPEQAEFGRAKWWQEVLDSEIAGDYPDLETQFIPRPCMHCENPPCVKVCPVEATYQTKDGLVAMNYERCIGCRMCTIGCPYAIRYFNWFAPEFPSPLDQALNPDVPTRPKGVVEKCTFCIHRIRAVQAKAKEEIREVRDAEMVNLPACNQVCPGFARYFGDLDDPESTVSRLAHSPRAFVLLEDLGTHPKVIYLKAERI
jgi:molybdopterin-containing oxidoreductase family iron-sulfur binding subunit